MQNYRIPGVFSVDINNDYTNINSICIVLIVKNQDWVLQEPILPFTLKLSKPQTQFNYHDISTNVFIIKHL